jgi:hypothetical protein
MCDASIDENRVAGTWICFTAVTFENLNMRQVAYIAACPAGELMVDFDGGNMSLMTHDFGHNRCVVTGATSHMNHVLSFLQFK